MIKQVLTTYNQIKTVIEQHYTVTATELVATVKWSPNIVV